MNEVLSHEKPLYYIDFFKSGTTLLQDISEIGYYTLEECLTAIKKEKLDSEAFEQEMLDSYETELRNFVLDLDTSDKEPPMPNLNSIRYDMKPHRYVRTENGYIEYPEFKIDNCDTLQATPEQIQKVNDLIAGFIDPKEFSNVTDWISQCHNEPRDNELIMCAINQVLEGYGIESIRTSKWKNGYWCDILCSYVNMGDSYTPTVIHHRKHGFMVISIGDLTKKNKHII